MPPFLCCAEGYVIFQILVDFEDYLTKMLSLSGSPRPSWPPWRKGKGVFSSIILGLHKGLR